MKRGSLELLGVRHEFPAELVGEWWKVPLGAALQVAPKVSPGTKAKIYFLQQLLQKHKWIVHTAATAAGLRNGEAAIVLSMTLFPESPTGIKYYVNSFLVWRISSIIFITSLLCLFKTR